MKKIQNLQFVREINMPGLHRHWPFYFFSFYIKLLDLMLSPYFRGVWDAWLGDSQLLGSPMLFLPSFPLPGTVVMCRSPLEPSSSSWVCVLSLFLSVFEVRVAISWGPGISPLVRQFIMRHSLFPSQAVDSKHFHLEFCPRILTILPIVSISSFVLSAFPFEPSACQLLL